MNIKPSKMVEPIASVTVVLKLNVIIHTHNTYSTAEADGYWTN